MHLITESERVCLRQFTLDDRHFILQLLNSEDWLKYIGDRNIKTTYQSVGYLQNGPLKSYRTNGFGLGLVQLKATGIPIGMCGFIQRTYLNHLDLGFAFLPEYTGQGYAGEIARQCLQYGFERLQQEKILAIVLPTNIRSRRLLEKIGLELEHSFISSDTNDELLLYSIHKTNYAAQNQINPYQ